MNTIHFTKEDKSRETFTSALKKNVNNYFKENHISTSANATMVIKTIAMVSLYLAPFILLLIYDPNVWISILLVVLMGIGVAGTGMGVMHDAVHGAYSKKKWVNKLLGSSLYLLGSNVLNWKIQHNVLHHTYTNINDYDEDIESKGPIRLAEQAPLKKIHKYQYIHAFFFYGLMTIVKTYNDFPQLAKYNRMGLTKGQNHTPWIEFAKMLFRKILYMVLIIGLPLYFTSFNWWQVLIGFFIMHWVAGFILAVVFQLAHVVEGAEQPVLDANGDIENEFAIHQLLTTADFARDNWFLNWFVGGLNFQVEHHLFPTICHVHYKNLSYIVEKTAKEFNLPYNLKPSFTASLKSHVERLKELGQA
ncbi:acyl-CoA desaturase [Crocinitomicaceae bacterium]|nr:acyl-CoA desaturase [Crocinitomicaceae bacterium]